MTYRVIFALAGASALLGGPAHGYSDFTHRKLSRQAYANSVLSAPGAFLRLGIKPTDMFPSPDIDGIAAPADIIPQGCREEDYTFGQLNVSNHFFDPANGGAALHPCNRDVLGVVGLCIPSPDWAASRGGGARAAAGRPRRPSSGVTSTFPPIVVPTGPRGWRAVFRACKA